MLIKIGAARDRKDKKGRKLPSATNMPKSISEKAKKLWKPFWKKYKKVITKFDGDYEKEWATAVRIFENYCLKRNVYPFTTTSAQTRSDLHGYMQARMDAIRSKVSQTCGVILRGLLRKEAIKGYKKEKIEKVSYNRGKFYVISTLEAQVTDPDEIRLFLIQKGFKKAKISIIGKNPVFRKEINNNYRIAVDIIEQRKGRSKKPSYKLKIYNIITLTKQQALAVVSPEDVGKDRDINMKKALSNLKKLFQFLMKVDKIEASSTMNDEYMFYEDFSEHENMKKEEDITLVANEDEKIKETDMRLTKLDQIYLNKITKEIEGLEPKKIFEKYDLSFFKSKSPALRKAIMEKIMEVLKKHDVSQRDIPFTYMAILKDPRSIDAPSVVNEEV